MSHAHHHHDDGLPQPAVYVLQTPVDLSAWRTSAEMREALGAFMAQFLQELQAGGCRLIGHIKGTLECVTGSRLYFNATSFSGGVTIAGSLPRGCEDCRLTLNAIVYTIEHQEVERAALGALERCLGRSGA